MRRAHPNWEMKFTDLFIKRPVLAMVVSFVILIAGLQAMKTLNVRQYPRSDVAAITVTTVYVGADAELDQLIFDGSSFGTAAAAGSASAWPESVCGQRQKVHCAGQPRVV